jgi:tRNA(adenine34) deaminase
MLDGLRRHLVAGAGLSGFMTRMRPARRWVRGVKTVSTYPPPGTFTGSAAQIARTMARTDVSPKGIGSGIRMIQYFINRAGKGLSVTRRRELERAKRILQRRRTTEKKRRSVA